MNRTLLVSLTIILTLAVGLSFLYFKLTPHNTEILNKSLNVKIKSGNLSTDYVIEDTLSDIKKLNLNTVNVPVVINIDNLSSDDMSVDKSSEDKAITLIKAAKTENINIILEPYPWIKNGTLIETNWKPKDINTFFWNWKTKVLRTLIDDIAVPYNVNALVVASNFDQIENSEGYWCDTIDYVRKTFTGLVTYKTNRWDTAIDDTTSQNAYQLKLNNPVFGKVDFISIAAYFELTDNFTNSVENLVSSLSATQLKYNNQNRHQNVVQELKNFYLKWSKPVFFGELGFPRRNGASTHPWDPNVTNVPNDMEQANCFEAYKEVFKNQDWVMGFSIFAIGQHGNDKNYYPSDATAKVIKTWYK